MRRVSLLVVSAEAGTVADVSAVDATAGGWMRFASGLRRVAIVALGRIRLQMRVLISVHRLLLLSRLFCRVSRWVSIVAAKRRVEVPRVRSLRMWC